MFRPAIPTTHAASSQERSLQLESRHQHALGLAEQCQQILCNQFGATQVIPFGSVMGGSPWHWDSDLDLAVVGLSHDRWLQACDALAALAPDWLKIDLVRLESVSPLVRVRILEQGSMSKHPYLALKAQLEDELMALEQSERALKAAIERAKPILEEYDIRALASYINDFYRRCERMSERVAVTLDGGLPQGQNWHQALLRQVAETGGAERPPLWSGALLLDLDEYRKFRHVVHHKYGDELKPEYVLALAELAPSILPNVRQALAKFTEWLEQSSTVSD